MIRARVLLVDPNRSSRDGLREVLEHYGFEVVPATSVGESLKAIASQQFDALICDLHIPNAEDGLAVLTAMRQIQPQAMTIGLRSASFDEPPPEADRILEKPIAVKELIGLLRTEMRKRLA